MGMAANTLMGALQTLTCFFIRLQTHSFGLNVRLFLTGDTDCTVWDDAAGLVVLFCLSFLQLEAAKGGDMGDLGSVLALLLVCLRFQG